MSSSTQTPESRPCLFSLGRMLATSGALTLLTSNSTDALKFFLRHQAGDWGDVDDDDKAANNEALQSGARLLSAYVVGEGRVWVITEAQGDDGHRSATTLLLPEEY